MRRTLPFLALFLLAGLAACDRLTEPGDPLADLDVAAIVQAITDQVAVFDPSSEANLVMWHAFANLGDGDGGVAAAPLEGARAPGLRAPVRSGPVAASVGLLEAPRPLTVRSLQNGMDGILGRTLVYDPGSGSWMIDESRTGAPADGFRIIWYAMSGFFTIALPLVERGHIDLTELDFETEDEFGFRSRITSTQGATTILADFTLSVVDTFDGSAWSSTITAGGAVTDGTRQTTFILGMADEGSASGSQFSLGVALASSGFDYALGVSESATSTAYSGEADISVTIDGATTAVELTWQSSDIATGSLSHRGVRVADITWNEQTETVTFTPVGGGSFTPSQQQALETLFWSLILPFETVAGYMFPFDFD